MYLLCSSTSNFLPKNRYTQILRVLEIIPTKENNVQPPIYNTIPENRSHAPPVTAVYRGIYYIFQVLSIQTWFNYQSNSSHLGIWQSRIIKYTIKINIYFFADIHPLFPVLFGTLFNWILWIMKQKQSAQLKSEPESTKKKGGEYQQGNIYLSLYHLLTDINNNLNLPSTYW